MRLHVSNIPFKMTAHDLEWLFRAHGPVKDAEVIVNDRGSKGYGFVTFESEEHAQLALETMNGMYIEGRKIEVNRAHPKNRFKITPSEKMLLHKDKDRVLNHIRGRHTIVQAGSYSQTRIMMPMNDATVSSSGIHVDKNERKWPGFSGGVRSAHDMSPPRHPLHPVVEEEVNPLEGFSPIMSNIFKED